MGATIFQKVIKRNLWAILGVPFPEKASATEKKMNESVSSLLESLKHGSKDDKENTAFALIKKAGTNPTAAAEVAWAVRAIYENPEESKNYRRGLLELVLASTDEKFFAEIRNKADNGDFDALCSIMRMFNIGKELGALGGKLGVEAENFLRDKKGKIIEINNKYGEIYINLMRENREVKGPCLIPDSMIPNASWDSERTEWDRKWVLSEVKYEEMKFASEISGITWKIMCSFGWK